MTKAMIRKSMTDCKNEPYFSITSLPSEPTPIFAAQSETLTPPSSRPIGGMSTFSTRDATILPNAAPMITPTARSTTGPFMANSLKSDVKLMFVSLFSVLGCWQPTRGPPQGGSGSLLGLFLGCTLHRGLGRGLLRLLCRLRLGGCLLCARPGWRGLRRGGLWGPCRGGRPCFPGRGGGPGGRPPPPPPRPPPPPPPPP